jgi:large subunit ribosomal protein L25
MEFITIQAERREAAKKRGAKAVRRMGHIPAIVYGKGKEALTVSVDAKTFNQHLGKGGRLFQLDMGGTTEVTMLKDLQWDTFGLTILHADFSRVADTDRIIVNTPIRLAHVSTLDLQGGALVVDMHSVSLEAQVTAIPDEIVLDVADLTPESPKTAADLILPPGAILQCNETDHVVHIRERPSVDEAEETGEEAAEAAKPEGEGGDS